jgi:nucleoside-diphosphate-sugar epimerase
VDSEKIILNMANSTMIPTIVRLGTAYGYSDRMRFDLVLNILTAKAITEGKIPIFHPENWRPLVHVNDVAEACMAILEAPEDKVNREIFNVGSNEQNYQIGELGRLVEQCIPGVSAEICHESEDRRNYRVAFDKINYVLGHESRFTVEDAVREISQKLKDGTIKDYRDDNYYNVRFKEYR